MHANEHVATADQVARLVAEQHPQWAGRPVTEVHERGTDHCLFRLGDDLVARMPRVERAVAQADTDARWLPGLVPHVSVALPVPVAAGTPGAGFPWRWSVVPWLPGSTPTAYDHDGTDRAGRLADDLAGFVGDLHAAPADQGPAQRPGARGSALAHWDDAVREAIDACGDRIDRRAVTTVWEDALDAPAWHGPPTWLHGDLMVGNLLVDDGRLTGVIDFGALGVGDPASDLIPAWCVLPASARRRFRDAVGYDDATWRRGRGWALGPALTGIPYYAETVPAFAERGLRTIAVLLGEVSG